jgi:uncharacterized membrane protein
MYGALGIDTSGQDCNAPQQEFSPSTPVKHGFVVQKVVTINKPRAEVYSYWRNFENLPRFMTHLVEVRVLDEKRSTWVAKAPGFGTVEWDAIITDERPDEMIAWHSARDAQVHNTGSVRFHDATGGRGTEVKVVLQYHPPAGALGAAVARLFGENPEQQIEAICVASRTFSKPAKFPLPLRMAAHDQQWPREECTAAAVRNDRLTYKYSRDSASLYSTSVIKRRRGYVQGNNA